MSFSPPRPADIPPALLNPEPTADKRGRQYAAALTRRGRRPRTTRREVPGLDLAELAAKYGQDAQNTTQIRMPIGIGWSRWEQYRNYAADRFLRALEDQGWQVVRLTAKPGVYPYQDVLTGLSDPDYREMLLVAECGLRKAPEPVVVTLEPEDLAPIVHTR
jgi:hypothetical protein